MEKPDISGIDISWILPFRKAPLRLSRTELYAWGIFFTAAAYYCFAYLLRIYPTAMVTQLRTYFNLTSAQYLSWLTVGYYLSYAPMQLIVGICVDRVGPRRSLLTASVIAITAVFLFASTHLFDVAVAARILMGLGASFAYVTALKVGSIWLPQRYFGTASGVVTGMGMISAIFTVLYCTYSVNTFGFFYTLYVPFFIGLGLILLIFLVLKDEPTEEQSRELNRVIRHESHSLSVGELFRCMLQVIKGSQIWIIGLVGALMYLPSSVFLDAWAMPYLQHVRFLSPTQAARAVSFLLGGWIFSSFCSGMLSDWLKTRKKPLQIACFIAAVIAAIILYMPNLSVTAMYTLMLFLGFACGPHPLCFALSKENYSPAISGTTVALTNFLIMMGGVIFQPVTARLLDWLWAGRIVDGLRFYSNEYMWALSVLPLGLIIAGVAAFFIKETGAQHR